MQKCARMESARTRTLADATPMDAIVAARLADEALGHRIAMALLTDPLDDVIETDDEAEPASAPAMPGDDTTYSMHTEPRRRSRPIERTSVITCVTAAEFATQTMELGPKPPIVERRRSRRVHWQRIVVTAIAGGLVVYAVAPTLWPRIAGHARDGVGLRDTPGTATHDVPVTLATSSIAAEPVANAPSPAVVVRSSAVPPAPLLPPDLASNPASSRPRVTKPQGKAKRQIVEPTVVPASVAPSTGAQPSVAQSVGAPSTVTVASGELPAQAIDDVDPQMPTPGEGIEEPPSDTPPLQDPAPLEPPLQEPPPSESPPSGPTPLDLPSPPSEGASR